MPPSGDDGGPGGGAATGGGSATGGGGGTTGGGGVTGGGGGGAMAVSPNVAEFSAAAGHVGQANGLNGDVQLGIAPARVRASGGTITLEGSAVLQP